MDKNNPFIPLFKANQFVVHPKELSKLKTFQHADTLNEYHEQVKEVIAKWYDDFFENVYPNSILTQNPAFVKAVSDGLYDGLQDQVFRKICYTEHFILEYRNTEDWYQAIVSYIERAILTFGIPAIGLNWYLFTIRHFVKEVYDSSPIDPWEFSTDKREIIIAYIDIKLNPSKEKGGEGFDLNLLHGIVQKWVDAIPDLPHFEKLKSQLENKVLLDVIFAMGKYNPYADWIEGRVRKPQEIINLLMSLTNIFLDSVDTYSLIKDGTIPLEEEVEYNEALIVELHRKTQAKLLKRYSEGELKYVVTIRKWLKKEEKFFRKIVKNRKRSSKRKDNAPKKETTFLELFKGNSERLELFWRIVKSDLNGIVNEDNEWVYDSYKSSIVACFQALEDLGFIKPIANKAQMHRMVYKEIKFSGTLKLFGNGCNPKDYKHFKELFQKSLK